MTTIGDDFPKQQERVRKLITLYESLPNNAGAFAIMMMKMALRRADEAAISGDIVEIISSYEELKGFKE